MAQKQLKELYVIEFIECYESLPSLWDKANPGYNSAFQRNTDYLALLEKHQENYPCDGLDELKAKIRNLRTCYGREQKRLERLRRSGARVDERELVPRLYYYEALSFIGDRKAKNEEVDMDSSDPKDTKASQDASSSSSSKVAEGRKSPTSDLAAQILNKMTEKTDHTRAHMMLCSEELNECDPAERLAAREVISNVVLKAKLKMLARAEYFNYKIPDYLRVHDDDV